MIPIQEGIDFDDVLIIPKPSTIYSRADVDISVDICGKLKLRVPIIASPMSELVGTRMISELGNCGGIGILHRFYTDSESRAFDISNLERSAVNFGVAVGLYDTCYKEAASAGASIICIDVANGYLESVLDFVSEVATYIKNGGYRCLVMAGNVATYDGAIRLHNYGADIIRVGIGSGGLCTTRNNTGIGYPQVSAIYDCSHEVINSSPTPWYTVADGGIRNSGDIVKALAAGADLVMIGSLFGKCVESDNTGVIYGMASRDFQEQYYGSVRKSIEGTSKEIEKTIYLNDLIEELSGGIRSACTYTNSVNLEELKCNAKFIRTGKGSIK